MMMNVILAQKNSQEYKNIRIYIFLNWYKSVKTIKAEKWQYWH